VSFFFFCIFESLFLVLSSFSGTPCSLLIVLVKFFLLSLSVFFFKSWNLQALHLHHYPFFCVFFLLGSLYVFVSRSEALMRKCPPLLRLSLTPCTPPFLPPHPPHSEHFVSPLCPPHFPRAFCLLKTLPAPGGLLIKKPPLTGVCCQIN